MKEIDISSWTLLSERVASSNHISPDGKWLVKYYKTVGDNELAMQQEEQAVSRAVFDLGIPTPEPGGIVRIKGGGIGALYQNIPQKVSLSRGISKDLSLMEEYMQKFVKLGSILHSTECDTSVFPCIEDRLLAKIETIDIYTEEEKKKLRDYIARIPKTKTCIHGDFHPGNFITSPQGDFAIDLGLFSYGNPIYDWAQWYMMSHFMPDFVYGQVFHMTKEQVLQCWELSKSGAGIPEEEIAAVATFYGILFIGIMPGAAELLSAVKSFGPVFR